MNSRRIIIVLAAVLAFALMGAVSSADEKDDIAAIRAALVADFGATYTDAELAAVDRALWAGNLTREDMRFNKDYTKGYACFPVVRAMMDDPLIIAPYMDSFIAHVSDKTADSPSPWPEFGAALETYPLSMLYASIATRKSEPPYPMPSTPEAWDTADLAGFLTTVAEAASPSKLGLERHDLIRDQLPLMMSWHDVYQSPYPQEQRDKWTEEMKDAPADYLYKLFEQVSLGQLASDAMRYLYPLDPRVNLGRVNAGAWPQKPLIVETKGGRVGIGTMGNDEWTGEFTILIDPGGDDHYKDCRIGAAYGTADRAFGYFADLGGNDFYDCGNTDITLGAAILGIAAFFDLGNGNDRYVAGNCTLGAAAGGIAIFYDDGGTDTYGGKAYTQGAAGFGIGLMIDDASGKAPAVPTDVETPEELVAEGFDNDSYTAYTNAQAFARTLGVAVCSNRRGNEVYHAGGVYLDAPLFSDRYQSFSQGFAIGERGIDYAGGIALMVDYAGNDRYLGDIYNQGVGYWYSAGLLWDGGGNDTYEMTQYGQGSGIHLAIGGLVDCAGNDTYVMHSGLGQGGSHDYAASILHDRGGNDHYMGMTSCNGTGLTNAVGIHIDRSGDDTYAGRRQGGINWGRPERGTDSIGLLVDLGGTDDYLGIMKDNTMWRQSEIAVGIDVPPPPAPPAEFPSDGAANVVSGQAPIPEVCHYEGPLTQEVFDELWEISIRWEVGDNRYIVPEARKRLIAFGPPVLPYLSKVMDNTASSLALRAFIDILTPLLEQDADGVAAILRENAASGNETREMVALYLIGEMKLTEL
jgi:hypothetical protein